MSEAFELMVQGEVICQQKHEDLFNYLCDESHRLNLNTTLSNINRRVRMTSDKKAFLCAYMDSTDHSAQRKIRSHFRDTLKNFQALIEWLSLYNDVNPEAPAIEAGEVINVNDISASIESSAPLQDKLAAMTSGKGLFGSTSNQSKNQLDHVIKRLSEEGYLIQRCNTGMRYQATGKFSMLYDQMRFIKEHYQLNSEEDQINTQAGLL
jgi:hypothetical protein